MLSAPLSPSGVQALIGVVGRLRQAPAAVGEVGASGNSILDSILDSMKALFSVVVYHNLGTCECNLDAEVAWQSE